MRIAYANARYTPNSTAGGTAHVHQFVTNAVALGHEVWMWPFMPHPAARVLPLTLSSRLSTLRRMDVIYIRVEASPPVNGPCRFALAPWRQLIGNPVVVWEFNTCPEYALLHGKSESDVRRAVEVFRKHARDCDLAACVSRVLSDYARDKLGLRRVVTVPNGSDPDMFRPDAPPVRRVQRSEHTLNVVWIGSADLSWHNLELLRAAAVRLWEAGRRTEIAFHIIGGGKVDMATMPPNVNYYGSVPYQQLPGWLSAMDVGLCLYQPGPSDYGSPLKLYDYMASGLAVVATPQPQVREVFDKLGQLDLLVPHDDPQALAALLLALAADRDRVRTLGRAARQLVIDHYNWRRAVSDTFREIKSLTA